MVLILLFLGESATRCWGLWDPPTERSVGALVVVFIILIYYYLWNEKELSWWWVPRGLLLLLYYLLLPVKLSTTPLTVSSEIRVSVFYRFIGCFPRGKINIWCFFFFLRYTMMKFAAVWVLIVVLLWEINVVLIQESSTAWNLLFLFPFLSLFFEDMPS